MQHYIEKIFTAPVYDVATKTPLEAMPRLSDRLGHNILCKREDLQPVFSFKLRGAYTKMYRLSSGERARGVICASAGNHAQGVALAANRLDIRAVIVMPVTTPAIKIDAVRRFGGANVEIVLHGDFYDAASQHAKALQEQHGYTYIHPFDDPDVIAGQGTIALEILTQHPHHIDAIFVPCGGGGMLAGIAVLAKTLRPDIKIIGVEPEDAASMTSAVRGGARKTLDHVGIFADGVAVKMPGELTYGLERIAMYLQDVDSVYDLVWTETPQGIVRYGDVYQQNEREQSAYNFEHADVADLLAQFDAAEKMAHKLAELGLPLPAYEQALKASHTFNLLDARRAISVTERQRYILRVRALSKAAAEAYYKEREALGFPLCRNQGAAA